MENLKKGDHVVFTLYDCQYEGEGKVVNIYDDYCDVQIICSQIIKVPLDSIMEII